MNFKKIVLPAVLALAVGIPAVAFAATTTGNTTGTSNTQIQANFQGHGHPGFGHGFKGGEHRGGHKGQMGMNANHEEYMLLLAEKYTPDQLTDWKTAFTARKQIMDQLKPLMQKQMTAKRTEMKQKFQDLQSKVKSGEITKQQARQQIQQWRQAQKGNQPNKADFAAMKALHDQFNQAVQSLLDSGNADQVKTVLPKMLDELKQQNQHLTDRYNQLKAS